jgi:3',5'-cyclic AMP phosphodiesterase CpdA
MAGILRDVEEIQREPGAPDAVFVAGDVAFSTAAGEYEAAEAWIQRGWSARPGWRGSGLVVPGNHDVDRKKAIGVAGLLTCKRLRASPADADEPSRDASALEKREACQASAKKYGNPEITAVRVRGGASASRHDSALCS